MKKEWNLQKIKEMIYQKKVINVSKEFNYFIDKNPKTKETVYIEYNKLKGYKVTPKTKPEDAVSVNKIVFVNPSFSEKIIKKKIDHKISALLHQLEIIDEDDSGDDGAIRKTLMDAERLKLMIINEYVKYLGHSYEGLTLKKIQIIINQLRMRLYVIRDQKEAQNYLSDDNKGRGR